MSDSLTDEQKQAVHRWAAEGADVAGIQKQLDDEFEVRLTFMDTRFLIADLGVQLASEQEEEKEEAKEPEAAPEQAAPGAAGDSQALLDDPAEAFTEPADSAVPPEAGADAATASATVTISELARPGMMASGTVTFDGGEKAEWYLDQMGQLGLNPEKPEFRPTPSQMRAFQTELQQAAQKKGY